MDTLSDEEIDSLANGGDQPPAAAEPRTPSSDHPDELSDEEMAHLEAKQPADDKEMGWGEYLGRGATGAVPYVAGAGGAALGTGLGLPGQIGGGALGYAGGKEAEQLLNHYLFGDENKPKSNMDKLKEVAGNTGEGALQEMGGIGVGKAMEKAAPYLGSMAEKFAVRHLRPTPAVARTIGKEKLGQIGREAIDNGSINWLGKAEGTAANLDGAMEKSGKTIGDMIEKSGGKANPVDIANRFDKEVIDPLRETSGNDALISKLEGQRDAFLTKYAPQEMAARQYPELKIKPGEEGMTAKQIEKQKRVEDDRVNWLADPKLNSKAQMGIANVLRDEGEKAVDDAGFPAVKQAYHKQALAKSMADRTAALTDGGTGLFGHMADLGVNLEALHGLASGNPVGVAAAAGRGLTKGRVTSTIAKSFDTAAKTLNADTAQRMGSLVSKPVWHRMLQKEKQP